MKLTSLYQEIIKSFQDQRYYVRSIPTPSGLHNGIAFSTVQHGIFIDDAPVIGIDKYGSITKNPDEIMHQIVESIQNSIKMFYPEFNRLKHEIIFYEFKLESVGFSDRYVLHQDSHRQYNYENVRLREFKCAVYDLDANKILQRKDKPTLRASTLTPEEFIKIFITGEIELN